MSSDDLQTLLAKQAIGEQLHNYCRAMDRIDNELGKRVWHPDGTADFGELYRGSGAGWVEQVSRMHATLFAHSHMVTNILVEVRGSSASSECYVSAILMGEADGKRSRRAVRGRYLDRWSLRDGRWAIDHRLYVRDLSEILETDEDGVFSGPWGHRDKRDPSYSLICGS